jgi:hypothetical protein
MPDLEGPEKYGGRILGQELWYQGRNGPLFLLVIGLLGAVGVLVYFTVDRGRLEHESIIRAMQANETQNRIGNWLMSISPDKRPQLQMPPEAWGLLSEDAKKKILQEYEDNYERRRR